MGNNNHSTKQTKPKKLKYNVAPQTYTIPNLQESKDCEYLRIVSWNVNMESTSSYAPDNWIQHNNKWDLVYQQIFEQNPDIVCLQELSKGVNRWNDKTQIEKFHPLIQKYMKTLQWEMTFSTGSHCGYCIILINKRLYQKDYVINNDWNIDPQHQWPGIILQRKIDSNIHIPIMMLYGVHFVPYPTEHNVQKRRAEFDRLYQQSKINKMQNYFVLIGDTNMRDNEELSILKDYKNELMSCCWNMVPQNIKKKAMYTWYRSYFYPGNPVATRYDKIFMGSKIKCVSIGVFDKSVSTEQYHFISDHRGIVAVLQIEI